MKQKLTDEGIAQGMHAVTAGVITTLIALAAALVLFANGLPTWGTAVLGYAFVVGALSWNAGSRLEEMHNLGEAEDEKTGTGEEGKEGEEGR